MNIFDPNNQRHREILREELARAKQIMEEVENTYDPDTLLAIKDKVLGRSLYRGILHLMKDDHRYNMLLSKFLRQINKATLEDLTVNEIDKFFTLLTRFRAKLNPGPIHDLSKSALTPDEYSANRGRGRYQGD